MMMIPVLRRSSIRPLREFSSACTCLSTAPRQKSANASSSTSSSSTASPSTSNRVRTTSHAAGTVVGANHLTAHEISSKKSDESQVDGIAPVALDRALGVVDPPTKGRQSREEWRKDLLNQDRRMGERKHLSVYTLRV